MNGNTKKYKFNIIDVLIILTIIAIGVVMYYYMSARNTIATNLEVDLEYTVELKTVHIDYLDKINLGDNAVETVRDQQIGEVVDIEISPSYVTAINAITGETYKQEYPAVQLEPDAEPQCEYYNVKVTIRDTFKRSDSGYKINAFELVIGEMVHFRVPHFVGEGYCISINELPKEVAVNEG